MLMFRREAKDAHSAIAETGTASKSGSGDDTGQRSVIFASTFEYGQGRVR